MHRKFAAFLFLVGLLTTFSLAQHDSEKSPATAPNGIALEIIFNQTRPSAFLNIYDNGANGGGWFPAFGRIPNFKTPPDALPMNAVNIIHRLEKDVVKIEVSIFKGLKFRDQEIAVANYSLREGERVSVKELTAFGIEPVEIAFVRVTPTVTALPTIVNKTDSLQVTGVTPVFSTLPAYKISVLNNSGKDVSTFTFEVFVNDKFRLSGGAQKPEGEILMEPGATYEKTIPNALHHIKTKDGQPPPVMPDQQLIISAVVFADGSYEGDALRAARVRAFNLGSKLQLLKIIDFSPENLEKQRAQLRYTMDENAFASLLESFPTIGEKDKAGLRVSVDAAAKAVESDFLKAFESVKNRDPKELRAWLKNANENHRRWLMQLP